MNVNRTAFILVDCENDFLSPDGKLYGLVKPAARKEDLIANINSVIDAAHSKGMEVVFTSMVFDPGYPGLEEGAFGIFDAVKNAGALVSGTWGTELVDSLHVGESDKVYEKRTMCTFQTTDLEAYLQSKGITTLVFGGLVTNLCLETSIRSAYDRGFETYALTDCMAALDPVVHEATVSQNFPMFSKPVDHNNFLEMVS